MTETTRYPIVEESSHTVSWAFLDPDDAAVASAALDGVTLTLYDVDTNTIINSRNDQDILGAGSGANNVVIAADGSATWYMQPADNAIVTSGSRIEIHVALIEWTWDPGDGNGVRQQREEIQFIITNLSHVP